MNHYIKKLVEGKNLTIDETKAAMNSIMEGSATEAQIGSFLTAMRMKGETIDEITACAQVMREKCTRLQAQGDIMDVVGTGGDCTNTFNVSTISSIVVAAAGVKVAKHGNRSVSSKCGAADILEALGVKLDITPEQNAKVLEEVGLCFMFAPVYHSSMKHVAKPRRELGIRTVFNILGPLANPAYANLQVLGVYDAKLMEPMANVLRNLGVKRAMVVHGQDGVDEVSLCAPTTVYEIKDGSISNFVLNPEMLGLKPCKQEELVGGEAHENKQITFDILEGKKGAKRDMVLINSAVALYTAYGEKNLQECVEIAAEVIDSGRALAKLEAFVAATQQIGE
ncbi:anthranilate phosphoribosyltransferase [Cellulosilyticum sp. I15G10I2]|uniref:anthranilate phosphoribosyltransferase n=1 Tax=Cellulosilyticum sp. I15G10I2 TaxID=1892843 RepID=UPI00085C951C|nr:anthranilate phosphoribosyltransferase [Cellulosilyticum sp. I15G10I2]